MENLLTRKKGCKYWPCHKNVRDFNCTFCYCPIYPCLLDGTGGKLIKGKNDALIWDCSGCRFIHENQIVDEIKEAIAVIIRSKIL